MDILGPYKRGSFHAQQWRPKLFEADSILDWVIHLWICARDYWRDRRRLSNPPPSNILPMTAPDSKQHQMMQQGLIWNRSTWELHRRKQQLEFVNAPNCWNWETSPPSFQLKPDTFVKVWTRGDLFIKRISVSWHLQHLLKWRCITYFTRWKRKHPSLCLAASPSLRLVCLWNAVQLVAF